MRGLTTTERGFLTWLASEPDCAVCNSRCLAEPIRADGERIVDDLHKRGLIVKWDCPYAPGSHGYITPLGRIALTIPCTYTSA